MWQNLQRFSYGDFIQIGLPKYLYSIWISLTPLYKYEVTFYNLLLYWPDLRWPQYGHKVVLHYCLWNIYFIPNDRQQGEKNTHPVTTYCKVASSKTSRLKAHAGFFRLFIKGIFHAYVLWPFGKNNISELVMRISTRHSTVDIFHSDFKCPITFGN